MAEIYRRTGWARCWLGGATSPHFVIGLDVPAFLMRREADCRRIQPVRGVRDTVNRPCFHRIWIVQEAALGRGRCRGPPLPVPH